MQEQKKYFLNTKGDIVAIYNDFYVDVINLI